MRASWWSAIGCFAFVTACGGEGGDERTGPVGSNDPAPGGGGGNDGPGPSGGGGGGRGSAGGQGGLPSQPGTEVTTSRKLDVLFVVDNSLGMDGKQQLLAEAMPELVQRLVEAPCFDAEGNAFVTDGDCAAGQTREGAPVTDARFGVISTSLGAYGAEQPCADPSRNQHDMGHLLGALRGTEPFVSWCTGESAASGECQLAEGDIAGRIVTQINLAGGLGCGWEATLESWYRFLVEPAPYTRMVRRNCPDGDAAQSCIGPETDASGAQLVDQNLLTERTAFLRPDSVLLIVVLSDEDDCSFIANGQTLRLAEIGRLDEVGNYEETRAFKGTATCAANPNDPCCHSCGTPPPSSCPTTTDVSGNTVGAGCEEPQYPTYTDLALAGSQELPEDQVNLRCWQQKQRYGVDFLYPVERYSNALTLSEICPTAPDLDPASCADAASVIPNPLLAQRGPGDIIVANIVGVPWQDVAVDPNDANLRLRDAAALEWSWLIGERHPGNGIVTPADPLMRTSIDPRTGVQPSTNLALEGPDAAQFAHPANGHEWTIALRDDLQFACVYPLPAPVDCPSPEEVTSDQPGCECTWYLGDEYKNPACQAPDGSYGLVQYFGKALPGIRPLQWTYDIRGQAVVASICPKQTSNSSALDYGYRPAVAAIGSRVHERLGKP